MFFRAFSAVSEEQKKLSSIFQDAVCYNTLMFFHYPSKQAARTVLALLLTGLLAGCGTQAQNALKVQENLEEAQQDVQVNPTDKDARLCVDRAIAIAPHDPTTYFGPDTPPNPNDPLPALSIEGVFQSVGDTPALADYMTQATQKFPTDVRGFQALAEAQQQLGQVSAQKATAAQLVVLLNKKLRAPGATDIMVLTDALAQAYFDAGDPVNGTATYKKAIQAYPAEPDPANGLAYAEAVSGTNLPEALTLARQAITLAQKQNVPDEQLALYQDTLGWVQYHQGDYPDAEQNLLQAANALPRLAEVRYHLGLVYAAQGNMEAARSELGHAVLLAQNYAAAQQALDSLPKSAMPKAAVPKSAVPATPAPKAPIAAR
jgi:tetratricopeptide (TPR) repeat protein